MIHFTSLELYMLVAAGTFVSTIAAQRILRKRFDLTDIYAFFGGITEFYAFVFTTVCIVMAFMNILSPTFVAAIGAIQAFVTANDVHNDLNNNQNTNQNSTTVIVDTSKPPADPSIPGGPH